MPFGKAFLTKMHDNTVKRIKWGGVHKVGGVGISSSIIGSVPQSSTIITPAANSAVVKSGI